MAFINLIPYEVAQSQGTADNWYRMLQAERAAQAQEIENQRNRFNAALTLRGLDVADTVRRGDDQYAMANLMESIRQSRQDDALRAQDLAERREDRRRRLQQEDDEMEWRRDEMGWRREAADETRQLRRDALDQAKKRNVFESAFRQVQVAPVDPDELEAKFANVLEPTQMLELRALNNRAIQEKYLDPNTRSSEYANKFNLRNALRGIATSFNAVEKGDDSQKGDIALKHWKEVMGETAAPLKSRWFRKASAENPDDIDKEQAASAFENALMKRRNELETEILDINKTLSRNRAEMPQVGAEGKYVSGVTLPPFVAKTASSGGVKRKFVFDPVKGEAVLQ